MQNDPIRAEGGVALKKNLEFVRFQEFQAEFWNSGFVTEWHNMFSFSGKNKFRMIQ